MNANEVLANIALELTGHKKGEYKFLEPHDDLNMSQSTNDSYPTAIKVALLLRNDKLIAELRAARRVVPREGRRVPRDRQDGTHRAAGRGADDGRPGVPRVRRVAREPRSQLLRDAEKYLYAVNMGATAIGTGINVPKGYAEKCRRSSSRSSPGKPIVPADDMFAATWDQQGFVVYSAALKSVGDQALEDRRAT